MTDWPSGLPTGIKGSIEEDFTPNYVDDSPEIGSARRRARYSRNLHRFSFTLRLDNTDIASLRTFINTTTSGGVTSFNWTHPITSTTYVTRFASLPKIRQATVGAWEAMIELEEI